MNSSAPVTPPPLANETSPEGLLTAIAWTAAAKWVAQVVSWASTLIVLRLLTAEDFGLVGMAATYLGFVMLLSEFGIGTAIVSLRDLGAGQTRQLHTLSVLLGGAGTLVSAAVAIPISEFFRSPEVAVLIATMGIGFAITGFRSVPFSLLQKDMDFRTLSWMEAAQSLIQATVCVLLAWFGAGYWALVLSGLAGTLTATFLPLCWRPISLVRPDFRLLADSFAFSWRVLVSRLSWYGFSNADFVVAGRVLGVTELGIYTVSWNLANMPGEKVASMVTRVTAPFFSAVQTDKAALRRYLSMLTEMLSVVMFPMVAGLAVLAPEFVLLALGDKWIGAVLPMQLLGAYTLIRSVAALLPQIMNVVGQTRFGMWHSLATLAVLPASFFLFSRWGIAGIASVWVVVYPLLLFPLYARTLKSIDMRASEYLKIIKPALLSCLLMTAALLAFRTVIPVELSTVLRLLFQILLGFGVYSLALWTLFPRIVRRYVSFARTSILKQRIVQSQATGR